MPLPLIPFLAAVGVAGVTAYTGKKGYEIYSDTKETGKYRNESEEIYNRAAQSLNTSQEDTQKFFEILGNMQAKIVRGTLKRHRHLMKKLEICDIPEFQGFFDKEILSISSATEDSIIGMTTTINDVPIDKVNEMMVRFGAFGYDGLLIGISAMNVGTLNSVSKKSATKTATWFGVGMTSGFVIGGWVASPLLLTFANVIASNSEKTKEDAKAYYASVKSLAESMEIEGQTWKSIANLAAEKMASLEENDSLLHDKIAIVDFIIRQKGVKLETWAQNELAECKAMLELAQSIVHDIGTPIMHDTDTLTLRLQEQQRKSKQIIEEINFKWGEKQTESK